MLFAPKKNKDFILPIGFSIIILLMISTAILSTTRIGKTHQTIDVIHDDTHSINSHLELMSQSVYQCSLLLFRMSMTKDQLRLNSLIDQLETETTKFLKTRESFNGLNLIQSKRDLMQEQSRLTDHNSLAVKELIRLLRNDNYEEAQTILNSRIFPLMSDSLQVLEKVKSEAEKRAKQKVVEIEEISHDEESSIIFFHVISILFSFLLMLYLSRKQRKSNADLSYLATTDTLTDLFNRETLIKHIDRVIEKDPKSNFSIIFFDIDYFKSINDMYGHVVGDIVLRRFSEKINNFISNKDVLARFGGDEFVLFLQNRKYTNDVEGFVKTLSKALDTSFTVDNDEIYTSSSIGISCYPSNGNNSKQLLKNADIAMYSAKEAGRNCYKFYSVKNSQKQEHEHQQSHALQSILQNKNSDNQLSLVYQPLININNDAFEECEALIRWHDCNGQQIDTTEFIEVAEKSNLIRKVNMFVIENACKQQFLWQQQGIHNVRIHINLSGSKRIFSELFQFLSENLTRYNLSPSLFGIELTERTIYETCEESDNSLKYFRHLGMKISIDDFGTGYSSLSYLKKLPITSVKIDRAFIKGIPNDKADVSLVKAIITLAHSLGFDVVAEGVETQQQLDFLKSCDCNTAQGYLLHRPLSPTAISKLKRVA